MDVLGVIAMSGLEVSPCICGGAVVIRQVCADEYRVECTVCDRRTSALPLEEAVGAWNEEQGRQDTWPELFDEFKNYFCRGWCNYYDYRCESASECSVYGYRKRAERLRGGA